MARKQVKSVSGKVVAITGGQGDRQVHGAGADQARRPGRDRRPPRRAAEKTATELGGSCVAFPLDVTSRESFERFMDGAEKELGPDDVLINNAGIMPLSLLVDEPDQIARLQIDINLHGVIFGTKIAMKRMIPRGSGHIVNVGSQAGKAGFPGGAAYCATKHAVVGLSEAARGELRDSGVEVSSVMPAIGVKTLEPEEVAEAIVEALETHRFDVWVPKSTAVIARHEDRAAQKRSEAGAAGAQKAAEESAGRAEKTTGQVPGSLNGDHFSRWAGAGARLAPGRALCRGCTRPQKKSGSIRSIRSASAATSLLRTPEKPSFSRVGASAAWSRVGHPPRRKTTSKTGRDTSSRATVSVHGPK
jgi:NAD(P)-dependent dehydrogenase (short-subunit alcohol dehydrogenase family)